MQTKRNLNVGLALALAILFIGFSSNPPDGNTGAPGDGLCSNCHNTPPPGVMGLISISGIPATVTPNTPYNVTATLNALMGAPISGGFQLVALNENDLNAGDLFAPTPDVGTDINGGREYMEHRGDKPFAANTVSWDFEWTAPSSAPGNGDITFYFAGNFSNNNSSNSGDRIVSSLFATNLDQGGGMPPTVTITLNNNVSCFGGNDGSATANPSGGTPGYSYMWSNGETTQTANNLPSGMQSVTITDMAGMTASANITITQPSQLFLNTISQTDVDCFGNATGSATIQAFGGTPGYTYAWSNNGTGPTQANLTAGNYSATVTDDNFCTSTISITINQPNPLTISGIETDASCFGFCDGSIDLNVMGGTPPYIFVWSNGFSGEDPTELCPDVYTVTVFDQNQCSGTAFFTINEQSPVVAFVSNSNNVTCHGENDGSATMGQFGGTPSYSILWSNGAMTNTINNLGPGTYIGVVTDQNGCTASDSVVITEPDILEVLVSTTPETSPGANDGTATATPSGGTPVYSYLWSTNDTTNTIQNLPPGPYMVTLTDENGCSAVGTSVVDSAGCSITTQINTTDVQCAGETSGGATAIPTGGQLPYSYVWSIGTPLPPDSSQVSDLGSGNYSLTVTDAVGCSDIQMFSISEPPSLMVDILGTDTLNCFGDSYGSLNPIVVGGIPTYDFSWNTGDTTQLLDSLIAGEYAITVTDSVGCFAFDSFTIYEPPKLEVSIIKMDETANNSNDGEAMAMVNGGTEPYSYTWSSNPADTLSSVDSLAPGIYFLTVSDDNNCIDVDTTIIDSFECTMTIEILESDISCNGASDGSLQVNPSGGNMPYSFLWSNGDTMNSMMNLGPDNYTVTVTDANNCTITDSLSVSEPDPLGIGLSTTHETGAGANDGTAMSNPTGGTSPYNYQWSTSPLDTLSFINNLAPGMYNLTLTDANSCQDSATFTINGFNCNLSANLVSSDVSCPGAMDGMAMVTTDGATGAVSYLWNTMDTTSAISNLGGGTYIVTAMDEGNCVVMDTAVIVEADPIIIMADQQDVLCAGDSTASITLHISDPGNDVTYMWSNGDTTQTISNLEAGFYDVTVTQASVGCSEIDSYIIVEPSPIIVVVDSITIEEVVCIDDSTALISLSVSGGTTPYFYNWSNGDNSNTIENLGVGEYIVEILDSNNCAYLDTFQVVAIDTVPPEAIVQDIIVYLDDSGQASIAPADIGGGSTDNCGLDSMYLDINTFNCDDLGENTVYFVVFDINGLCDTDSAIITVLDTFFPSFTVPADVTLLADSLCFANTDPVNTGEVSNEMDNCSGGLEAVFVDSMVVGSCQGQLTIFRLWSLSDAAGNTVFDTQFIVIEDMTPPSFTLPADIILYTDSSCMADTTTTSTGDVMDESDNCSTGLDATYTDQVLPGSALGEFQVIRTWTLVDDCGNVSTGVQTIEVMDTIPPILICPDTVISISCPDTVNYTIQTSDNCSNVSLTQTMGLGSGAVFPPGLTTESYTAMDDAGNMASCFFDIDVQSGFTAIIDSIVSPCPDDSTGLANVLPIGGVPPYSYLWSDPAMQTTQTATGLTAGPISVTVTDALGCMAVADSNISALPGIELEVDTIIPDMNITFSGAIEVTVTGAGPFSFNWVSLDTIGYTSTQEDPVNMPVGSYRVTVTDANGCTKVFGPIFVPNITNVEKADFSVALVLYPNPTEQLITIQDLQKSLKVYKGYVKDSWGRTIWAGEIRFDNKASWSLEVGHLPSGVYYLGILGPDQVMLKPFVKH